MRISIVVSALLSGLAVANPVVVKQQDLPTAQYDAVAYAISATGAPVGDAAPQSTAAYDADAAASQVVQQITTAAPAVAATETVQAVSISVKKNKRDAVCTTHYERVPLVVSKDTQVPDSNICPATNTSSSATLIKCAFYGKPLLATQATNVGQFQGQFNVVIAGSNAYVKSNAPSLDCYEGPVSFGNATINAPAPVIDHGYLRVQTFGTNVPFDPSLCAASCAEQTAYNAKHGTFGGQQCVFFNAYILYKNGANGVFTCTYYGTPCGTKFATNVGQWNDQGDHWTIGSSYGYYLDGYYVQ